MPGRWNRRLPHRHAFQRTGSKARRFDAGFGGSNIDMSRFVNLELDDHFEDDRENRAEFSKDEAYYVAQAEGAWQNGKWEVALRNFGKVLEHNPRNNSAWCGQVRMLIELGELREAKVWADKALERFADDPELLAAKAVALARLGDLQAAMAFSDASIQERGETPYVWLARGDVLTARREARADYCFDKAILLGQGSWIVAWMAGRIRMFYERFSLALKNLQQAVEWNPSHSLLWLELGLCQEALGLAGPARRSFDQAVELNPHCESAHMAIARLHSSVAGRAMRGFWYRLLGR